MNLSQSLRLPSGGLTLLGEPLQETRCTSRHSPAGLGLEENRRHQFHNGKKLNTASSSKELPTPGRAPRLSGENLDEALGLSLREPEQSPAEPYRDF